MIAPRVVMLALALAAARCNASPSREPADPDDHPPGAPEPARPAGVVDLTPEQVATSKITLASVEKRAPPSLLSAAAELAPIADRVARIGPRVAGRIVTVLVNVGDAVHAGQPLATIDAPELGRAAADYVAAVATAKVARQVASTDKKLFSQQLTAEREWRLAEAEAARAAAEAQAAIIRLRTLGLADDAIARLGDAGTYPASMTLSAPFDAVVAERAVTVGEMVEPKDVLFVVTDLSQVWAVIDIYEHDLAQVKIGQTVRATVGAYPARAFPGTVASIATAIDPASRAVAIRAVLPNPDGALKPGMFAQVEIDGTAGEARAGLFVPETALQRDKNESIVFVPSGEHRFARREVEVGRRAGAWIEVLRGLTEGEAVVTTGAFVLKSELEKAAFGEDND